MGQSYCMKHTAGRFPQRRDMVPHVDLISCVSPGFGSELLNLKSCSNIYVHGFPQELSNPWVPQSRLSYFPPLQQYGSGSRLGTPIILNSQLVYTENILKSLGPAASTLQDPDDFHQTLVIRSHDKHIYFLIVNTLDCENLLRYLHCMFEQVFACLIGWFSCVYIYV